MKQTFIRVRELATTPGRTGRLPVTPATVWRWVARKEFPAPVRLGPGTTAWRMSDVEEWEAKQRTTAGA